MRKVFVVALMLVGSISAANAQTLNCSSAYTPMERTICGDAVLLQQVVRLAQLTQQQGNIDVPGKGAVDIENELARSCRSADNLAQCLYTEVALALDAASADSDTYSVPAHQTGFSEKSLRHRLELAGTEYARTSNPEQFIATILATLQLYERMPVTPELQDEVFVLMGELTSGCDDFSTRRQWNQALQVYGRICPLNFASSDFD